MRKVRTKTRIGWVKAELGRNRSYTPKQFARAQGCLAERKWVTAMPPDGSVFEWVAFVHRDHAMARVVSDYNSGVRQFPLANLDRLVGAPVVERSGAVKLATTGFAVAGASEGLIELRATDPREARLVNIARCGPQLRGFAVRGVLEAILRVRDPRRTRVNVNDDRRLLSAEALYERWLIECDDLLAGRNWVRLFSLWTYRVA